ncbi:MAG: hypothetical protein HN368_00145, partial [Spirochaetales bacterium]|nr:hypothetical protein [Spirochaetales bacterium]
MNKPVIDPSLSLGFPALTDLFHGMIPGDNIVWNTDDISNFIPLSQWYVEGAKECGKQVVYLRYANHEPLVEQGENV